MAEKNYLEPESLDILIEILLLKNNKCESYSNFQKELCCSICTEDMFETNVIETPCNHFYHLDCLLVCIRDFKFLKCPECLQGFE